MKKPIFSLLFLLTFSYFSIHLSAQQAVLATGGEAAGTGGSVSYSVGQVVYTTNDEPNFSEAQGVQQPYEISVVTNTVELDGQLIQVQLFPNPTVDQLTLSLEGLDLKGLSYELYDLSGRQISRQVLSSVSTSISLGHLPAATYLLKVLKDEQLLTNFKILKN